jgi:rRNA maturation protein Rpf1
MIITDWTEIITTSVNPSVREIQFTKSYSVCHIIKGIILSVITKSSAAIIPKINAFIIVNTTIIIPVPENA